VGFIITSINRGVDNIEIPDIFACLPLAGDIGNFQKHRADS